MTLLHRYTRSVAFSVLMAMTLAACGSHDDDDDAPPTAPTTPADPANPDTPPDASNPPLLRCAP